MERSGRAGAIRGSPKLAQGKTRPTFVLLHGLLGSTASWDEVVEDLAECGRVISFDRPGFGKTERVMPVEGLPWGLCPQTLGENPYSADFAAKVALRAARARPDMVQAMVLVAPAVLNPLDSRFVIGRDPGSSLFSPLLNLRTRVEMTAKLAAFNLQEKVRANFHDPSIALRRPELLAKYLEPLKDPLWDRGLLFFYRGLQAKKGGQQK